MNEISPTAFYILAALLLFPAVTVVTEANLFHAGIAMILSFLGVAGLYITLGAPFLAGIQVLVYVGAISVILLFAFMLTRGLMHSKAEPFQRLAGMATAGVVAFILALTGFWSTWAANPDDLLLRPASDLGVKALAQALMTDSFVPFQVIALVLLVSLVGAVVIVRKEEGPPQS